MPKILEFNQGTDICTLEEFFAAVATGNVDEVEKLIYTAEYLEKFDETRRTPLQCAAALNHIEMVKYLLRQGAEVDRVYPRYYQNYQYSGYQLINPYGGVMPEGSRTALHIAAREGHFEIVELLLANKANVEAKANWNYTPLIFAALFNRVSVIKILFEHGADWKAETNDGRDALFYAVKKGHFEVVKYLLLNIKEEFALSLNN